MKKQPSFTIDPAAAANEQQQKRESSLTLPQVVYI
jgi:hypothetical protein